MLHPLRFTRSLSRACLAAALGAALLTGSVSAHGGWSQHSGPSQTITQPCAPFSPRVANSRSPLRLPQNCPRGTTT